MSALKRFFSERFGRNGSNQGAGSNGVSVVPPTVTPATVTASTSTIVATPILAWTPVAHPTPHSAIPGLFNSAIDEIAKMVKRDTFSRFKSSEAGSPYQACGQSVETLKAAFRTQPDFVMAFLRYTYAEKSIENVLFLTAALQAGGRSIEDQQLIFDTFVSVDADRQINLPYDMKNNIYTALGVPIPSSEDYDMSNLGW